MKNRYWLNLILTILIFLGVFFRFYNLKDNVAFVCDQETTMFKIAEMVHDKKISLIGPRVGPGKFFLPPLYYYLVTPFLILMRFDPIGLYYSSAVFGVLSGVLIYLLFRRLFDEKTALIASGIYFFSPALIYYDRIPWNVNLLTIAVCLCLYGLINILTKDKQRIFSYLILGLGLGLGINAHFTAVYLVVIILIILLIRGKAGWKFLPITIITSIIILAPIIIFEFRHNFLNIKAFLEFLSYNKNLLPLTMPIFWSRVWHNLFISFEQAGDVVFGRIDFWGKSIIGIILFTYTLYRLLTTSTNKRFFYIICLVFLLIPVILFGFYASAFPEYYFFIHIPIYILLMADILVDKITIKPKSLNFLLFIVAFLMFIGHDLELVKQQLGEGLAYKQSVINYIKQQADTTGVKITYAMPYEQTCGYNYLLSWRNVVVDDNASNEFTIAYPMVGEIRKTDYEIFGNIGVKTKSLNWDKSYYDYFDQYYRFSLALPHNLTIIDCSSEMGIKTLVIANKLSGSCNTPFDQPEAGIYLVAGDDKKISFMYKANNKNPESVLFVPREQDKSLLLYLKNNKEDLQLEQLFESIKNNFKAYGI